MKKTISETDLDLFCILDDPQEIVDEIFNYYEQKGFLKNPQPKKKCY